MSVLRDSGDVAKGDAMNRGRKGGTKGKTLHLFTLDQRSRPGLCGLFYSPRQEQVAHRLFARLHVCPLVFFYGSDPKKISNCFRALKKVVYQKVFPTLKLHDLDLWTSGCC